MSRGLSRRLSKIEKAVGSVCPGCAGRPASPGVLYRHDGRLLDSGGREVDPASLEPCPVCGKRSRGAHIIAGVDPGGL